MTLSFTLLVLSRPAASGQAILALRGRAEGRGVAPCSGRRVDCHHDLGTALASSAARVGRGGSAPAESALEYRAIEPFGARPARICGRLLPVPAQRPGERGA